MSKSPPHSSNLFERTLTMNTKAQKRQQAFFQIFLHCHISKKNCAEFSTKQAANTLRVKNTTK